MGISFNDLGIRDAIAESIVKASQAVVGTGVKELLSQSASAMLESIAEESVKAIAGSFLIPFLKILLGVSDKIQSRLDKQIREPFNTGVRAAQYATRLPARDIAEIQYREQRLNFAMNELERAWTLAVGTRAARDDQLYIRLVQGLCAKEIRGGQADARVKFDESAQILETELQEIESAISVNTSKSEACRAEAKSNEDLYKMAAGSGYFSRERGYDGPSPLAEAYRFNRRADFLDAESKTLTQERDDTKALLKLLRAM